MESIQERIMTDIAALLPDGASFSGEDKTGNIGTANIYKQLLPDPSAITMPCILVDVENETEQEEESNFEEKYVVYPCRISIIDRANAKRNNDLLTVYLKWRHDAMNKLRDTTRLDSVPEAYDVRVQPRVIVSPNLPEYQYFVTGFVVQVYTTETRNK